METEQEGLISIKEMAKILSITPDAIRQRLFRDKNIPHYKVGGTLRFNREEVLNYFKRGGN